MQPDHIRFPAQAGNPVFVSDFKWRRMVPRAEALAALAAAAAGEPEASIVLASDREVKRLNVRHRGKNKPTNVLSFEPPLPGMPGEIVLALGTVRREAAASGKRAANHLAHLVVHGCLHLQGHDHDHPGDARRMEMAESRILARLKRPNPWKRA